MDPNRLQASVREPQREEGESHVYLKRVNQREIDGPSLLPSLTSVQNGGKLMRFSKERLPCLTRAAAAAIAVLGMLAIATPAAAADKDYKGWFVALDFASTQPNSLDQHYANHYSFAPPPLQVERLVLENDSDFTYRASAGYSFGGALGSLKVSYWSFDNEDKLTDNLVGGVYPTIFGYGYYGGMYIYNGTTGVNFTTSAKVKASTTDLDYVRPIVSGEKSTLSWLAGLRVASYEETRSFVGSDGVNFFYQDKNFESDGMGLRVGAAAEFGFTEHFSMVSSMVFSFLQADTEGTSSQLFGTGGQNESVHGEDDNIRGEIRDFDIKAVWSFGHLDYWVGYEVSSWDGLVNDPIPPVGGGFNGIGSAESRSRDNISFNSAHVGVKWRFGKAK